MKNTRYIVVMLLFWLFGCQTDAEQSIEIYEQHGNQIRIIKYKSVSTFSPFYDRDSIKMLEQLYDSVLHEKTESLENQLDIATLNLRNAEIELKTIENPLMAAAYENRVQLMRENKQRVEEIIVLYRTSPERTELNQINENLHRLKQFPDSIMGFTLKVSFYGRQGELPKELFHRKYLFDYKKDCLVGVIVE